MMRINYCVSCEYELHDHEAEHCELCQEVKSHGITKREEIKDYASYDRGAERNSWSGKE